MANVSPIAEDPPRRLAGLLFCVAAGPSAWSAHLVLNYARASRLCFSAREPLVAISGAGGTFALLVGVDLVVLAICAAGVIAALRLRRAERERTKFLAQFGLLASVGFAVATIFDTIPVFMVPLCAS